jgi:hypothetical protein
LWKTSVVAKHSTGRNRKTQSDPERALLAAGWFDPVQLARDADRLRLHVDDFTDRMLGTVAGYVRICGESGRVPTLREAEAALDALGVPRDRDEVFWVLNDSLTKGVDLTDLIIAVQRAADDRAEQLTRELARDGLRTLKHAFECPRCIACACGEAHTVTSYGTVWSTPSATGKAAACA